jgi:serine/threonine-protein kinase HipA
MAAVNILEILLGNRLVGTITLLDGDQSIFAFTKDYIEDPDRPTLSLSFRNAIGGLITQVRPTQTSLSPFFSNLLPEGALREYLAKRAGVDPVREFFLLWMLGQDLPGAIVARPADGQALPAGFDEEPDSKADKTLRFSLAGVQLKFSAIEQASGGLTIPTRGVGGHWIVKLPSLVHEGVSENEYSMMHLARTVGVDTPNFHLVDIDEIDGLPDGIGRLKGQAFAIKRFDRTDDGGKIHIEDFAQVFGLYPRDKYGAANYRNIAEVIWTQAGEVDIREFIRRLVFNVLIGNGDMHVKNWSLVYPDRRNPRLAQAYDFVSTVGYISDDGLGLNLGRTKAFAGVTWEEFDRLAAKAGLPSRLVRQTGEETVERFHAAWRDEAPSLPIPKVVRNAIVENLGRVPIAAT